MTAATQQLAALVSEDEYEAAHNELRRQLARAPQQRDDARVRALGLLIDDYERVHFPADPPPLTDAILARMEDFDLSAEDLAERAGARPQDVTQLLRGDFMVPFATVLAVAAVLGLPGEVVGGPARARDEASSASGRPASF